MKKITALVIVLIFSGTMSYATEFLPASTPYDKKLRECGLFGIPTSTQQQNGEFDSDINSNFRIAKSFRYIPDASNDYWQSPDETDARKAGDCEDKAIWLFARLINSGRQQVRLVVGQMRQVDSSLHVWVTCEDSNGTVYLLDPSAQKKVWKASDFAADWYRPLYAYDGTKGYSYRSR